MSGAVRVVRWAVKPKRWPEGLRLRVVMIADLHACRPWMPLARIRAIVAQAQALEGDLIALMGDYPAHIRLSKPEPVGQVARALAQLSAPLGVWAVFGNHDWRDDPAAMAAGMGPTLWHRAFEAAGLDILENRHEVLQVAGQPLGLIGVGSQRALPRGWRRRPAGVDDLPRAVEGLAEEIPQILLAHEPDIFPELPDHVDLTLSGHTHGGQVRLFNRPWVVPSRHGRRYAYGVHETAGRALVVSGGLGCSGLPIRWRMPPELTVVEVG